MLWMEGNMNSVGQKLALVLVRALVFLGFLLIIYVLLPLYVLSLIH